MAYHLLFLSFLLLIISHSQSLASTPDVHDLLPKYGFPRGLIPNAVKSYSLSSNGDFTINLYRPCYVHYDQVVYYNKKITGKLAYGSVTGVSGIQAKKLFVWVSVTGIEADVDAGMIEFWVGPLYQKMPAKNFQKIPDCKNKGCHDDQSLVDSM